MVEVQSLSKSFGKQQVLYDISFTLTKEEITAFIGINGAGKSTTLNIITGAIPSDKGKVFIKGIDPAENPVAAKKNIGYLPENNPLYEDMYVKEYLGYAASFYLPRNSVEDKVSEMIEMMNLENEYKKKIHSLSHGNKQRVGIAQALIHEPDVLILDEPSNGLDPVQQIKINNLIKELGKSHIILFSSHRFDDISDVADRYLIINNGRLILDEKAENIDSIKEYFYSFNKASKQL